jgi:hypothetical protein
MPTSTNQESTSEILDATRNKPTTPRALRWHYTIGLHFRSISNDGAIVPATAHVDPPERPIVWFSANQDWEPTAAKGIVVAGVRRTATFEETYQVGGGLVRIGVTPSVAKYDWHTLQRRGRIPRAVATGLVRAANDMGADPAEWFGTFAPVSRDRWSAVDVWEDGAWVRVLDVERAA